VSARERERPRVGPPASQRKGALGFSRHSTVVVRPLAQGADRVKGGPCSYRFLPSRLVLLPFAPIAACSRWEADWARPVRLGWLAEASSLVGY
jgi:hypothetical protein